MEFFSYVEFYKWIYGFLGGRVIFEFIYVYIKYFVKKIIIIIFVKLDF